MNRLERLRNKFAHADTKLNQNRAPEALIGFRMLCVECLSTIDDLERELHKPRPQAKRKKHQKQNAGHENVTDELSK